MDPTSKRKLGRVDLEVTALSLGSVAIGNLFQATSNADADAVINGAWDAGIRYYDTAPLYGHGLAELRMGHSLRPRRRDDYVLSSKVGRLLKPARREEIEFGGWVDAAPFDLVLDYSYDGTMRAFEDCLQRLGVERMDICFIHDIDHPAHGDRQPEVFKQAMDGSWRALEKLRSEGVVKAIGVGVNEWQVCYEALRQRDFDCFLLAGRYTLLEQEPLDKLFPLCVERNVAVVMGGGFNSGILATGAVEGARYNYGPASPEIMQRVMTLEAVCREHRVSLQAAAMQFVIAHPVVASLIAGMRNIGQLEKQLQWFTQPIPAAFWSDMKKRGLLREDAPVPSGG